MDEHLFSCGVFIDLKKAFDTASHKIILHKLDHYGFYGVINTGVSIKAGYWHSTATCRTSYRRLFGFHY